MLQATSRCQRKSKAEKLRVGGSPQNTDISRPHPRITVSITNALSPGRLAAPENTSQSMKLLIKQQMKTKT